jgi:taurine transport system permease protein
MKSVRSTNLAYFLIAVLSPAAIGLLWVVSTRYGWVRSVILPPPAAVWQSAIDFLRDGYGGKSLAIHFGASAYRVGIAFAFGAVLGVIFGVLRATSPALNAALLVPTEILRPVPPLGLIPLFILWFGLGELSKIMLIFIPVFLITMINTQAGVQGCNPELIRASRCFGASRIQTFISVLLPSALPQIIVGLRVALGTALSVLVAAELLGADKGLGFIILDASNFFKTSYVVVGIAVIGFFGLFCDRVMSYAARHIAHWEGRT